MKSLFCAQSFQWIASFDPYKNLGEKIKPFFMKIWGN